MWILLHTHLFKCAFARFHRWGYVEQSWLHATYLWVFWLILSPKAFRSPSFQTLHSGSSVVVFLGWLSSSSGPSAKFVFIFLLFVPALLRSRCHDSNCFSYFCIHVSLTKKKLKLGKTCLAHPFPPITRERQAQWLDMWRQKDGCRKFGQQRARWNQGLCHDLQRLDPSDLFLPARLWLLRVPQSPKIEPPKGRKLQNTSFLQQFLLLTKISHSRSWTGEMQVSTGLSGQICENPSAWILKP